MSGSLLTSFLWEGANVLFLFLFLSLILSLPSRVDDTDTILSLFFVSFVVTVFIHYGVLLRYVHYTAADPIFSSDDYRIISVKQARVRYLPGLDIGSDRKRRKTNWLSGQSRVGGTKCLRLKSVNIFETSIRQKIDGVWASDVFDRRSFSAT